MKLSAEWLHDETVQQLFSAFETHGHQIFFVGGCVRNTLLNVPVSDLDVSTSATPNDTIDIAQDNSFNAIPTGIDHGTVTVIANGQNFEITSFRKDVETRGRRAVVAFSKDINDDALRRDFTMNALYANRLGEIIDPLNGMDDLIARRVRFIQDADRRIKEDYLRILRYFRFHAQHGDQIQGFDPEALSAIAANLDGLAIISKERIGQELRKLLSVAEPVASVAAMEQSGVLNQILPGASSQFLGPLTLIEAALDTPADWQRRLLVLGGEGCVEALRLSKSEALRRKHFKTAMDAQTEPAETAYRYGKNTALDVAMITHAGLQSYPPSNLLEQIEHALSAQFPVSAADLPSHLQGKEIGDALRELEITWIASGFRKTKQELLR